ncbi:MAG: DUF262 domain-containing protein [Gallionella sp.]|nr:DUF262 domain-containing protein [Gallionella sp.]
MQLDVKHPAIEEVFKDFYEVPQFQREYVWKAAQVEALLSDALDALFDENGSPTQSEYFIGSIVAYKENDVFQLIDGQQRITSLFIALCAFRDRRKDLEDRVSLNILEKMIQDEVDDENGIPCVRLRLKPLYEDAGDALNGIASGEQFPSTKKLPNSAQNMLEAYATAYEFLEEEFGADVGKLRAFQAALTKRVRLVRIQTGSVADALRIFETINDRGVGLNALDLLKNLLFRQADSKEFDRLTGIWKDMVHTIETTKKGEKALRFLRYFVLSRYPDARKNGKPLTEDHLYEWLVEHQDAIGISKDPVGYAKQLLEAAKLYKQHVASPGSHLAHIYQLSARARQHLIVMLATEGLHKDELDEVGRQMENLFVAFVLIKETTKALDIIFSNAAPALYAFVQTTPDTPQRISLLRDHLAAWIQPEIAKRLPRIEASIDGLSLERKTASRFVLCRIAQYVEGLAGCQVAGIEHYWGYHIEHILPNQPTPEQREKFDKTDMYDSYKQRLGNLTLLEQSINCAIGRDFFIDKQPHYQKSALFMTKSLTQSQAVGIASAFAKTASLLPTFSEWNSANIDTRHRHLKQLALNVWDFS